METSPGRPSPSAAGAPETRPGPAPHPAPGGVPPARPGPETPAGTGTAETPAATGTPETPAGTGTAEAPAASGGRETPADADTRSAPEARPGTGAGSGSGSADQIPHTTRDRHTRAEPPDLAAPRAGRDHHTRAQQPPDPTPHHGRIGRERGGSPAAPPREPGHRHRRARHASGVRRRTGPLTGGATREPRAGLARPAGHDPGGTRAPAVPPTRRRAILVALAVAAVASAAALVAGLQSWAPAPADPARVLTRAEAERLAAMRVTNLRDVRAGVRVTVGTGSRRTEFVGWVDWARPLVYLDVSGPGAGADRGLVQASGSALVLRSEPAERPAAPPPLVPPADRWRLREPPGGSDVAAVRDLLLGLSADRADAAPAGARWLGRETAGGTAVDKLQAPLPGVYPPAGAGRSGGHPSAGPTRADPSGPGGPLAGQARLWLDQDARLHRLEGRLADGRPVTVDLQRSDRPTLRPVDALGGRPGLPRALTDEEADRLARLPVRLRASGGAAVTVTAPLGPAANLRAAGWLRWAEPAAYLTVVEAGSPGRTLLRWRPGRVDRADVPAEPASGEVPAPPPLPPPAGATWTPGGPAGGGLDRLLAAALRAGGHAVPEGSAIRLRDDRVADRTVDVIEFRSGGTPLRWWLDRSGQPRRLELPTGPGVWAQLDLSPGRVRALPEPATPG